VTYLKWNFLHKKCLVVHFHPTSIPPLFMWTNNVRNSRKSVGGYDFFNNIISPHKGGIGVDESVKPSIYPLTPMPITDNTNTI
jgi:hypothetical protein